MIVNRLNHQQVQRRAVFILALVFRLAYLATSGLYDRFLTSGDSLWYIQTGWLIRQNALPFTLSNVGPLYPLMLAAAWVVFPGAPNPTELALVPAAYLIVIRLVQIVFSLLMVRLGYQLTYRLTGDHRHSIIAAIGMGLGPAFVAEPFHILTETIFMALLVLAVWFYTIALQRPSIRQIALAGFVLGLTALARPILIGFPICLAPHLMFHSGSRSHMSWLGAFLGMYLLVLMPWGIYIYQSTGSIIPEGLFSNLWIGSTGTGKFSGPETTDKLRRGFEDSNAGYAAESVRIISADPTGWLALHVRNAIGAVLQPHGTDNLPDLKIKQAFIEWLQHNRSLGGLWALLDIPGFWAKLTIYLFHYTVLIFGAIGVWFSFWQWRKLYMPFSGIVYFFCTYGILTILPRYLFPAQIFLCVFAGVGLAGVWQRLARLNIPAGIVNKKT